VYRVYADTVTVQIPVILEEGEHNWGAFAPSIPGCVTTGRDREETLKNIAEAISFHLDSLHRDELNEYYANLNPELKQAAEAAQETLTLPDAARLSGVSLAALNAARRGGELAWTISPEASEGRRRVRRVYRQEVERWAATHAGQVERKPRRVRSA